MLNFLSKTSINKRLQLSMLLSLLMLALVAFSGWKSMTLALDNANQLNIEEINLVQPTTNFHRDYIMTLQSMNDYIITMNENSGAKFEQQITKLKESLRALLTNLGAELEKSGDGFLILKNTGAQYNTQDIKDLFALDQILHNIKKSTDSSVFLRKNMINNFSFGLENNAKRMTKDIIELRQYNNAPATQELLSTFEKNISFSQLQAAKMVTTLDTSLFHTINEQGMGDTTDTLLTSLTLTYSSEQLEAINQHRDDYLDSIKEMRDSANTIAQNNQMISRLSSEGNVHILAMTDRLEHKRADTYQQMAIESEESRLELIANIVFAVLLGLILTRQIVNSIVRPLEEMRLAVEQVSHTGKFNTMKMLTGNNELTQMQASLAAMMQDIQLAIDEVSRVSHAMSRGQLHERMQANYCGDLAELSQSVNESVGNVCHTLDDLEKAAIALEKGDLNHQISLDAYYGQYRSVVESIDQAIAGQKNAIEDVRRVTRAMREGDFSQRISVEMPGDLSNLKRYLNEALVRLEEAINQKGIALQHFSQGDFSYVMPGVYTGKLLDLKTNMGKMAQNISNMITDVQVATGHAVDGVKEISTSNQDLNRRVQKQALDLSKTTLHMQDVNDSISDTLSQADIISRNSEQMRDQSQSGIQVVNQMVAAMKHIQQASEQVSGMTDIINSISFQTNLLALNAAVEAARAGESGRGFAVVAAEVRSLAQKTAEAAKNIQLVTEKNLQHIQHGLTLSQLTHDAFSTNADAIERISTLTEKMHLALDRQSNGIHEVSQALEEIDKTTQQNAAMVEQIASTSDNIISEVLTLESRIDQFRLLAKVTPANDSYQRLMLPQLIA